MKSIYKSDSSNNFNNNDVSNNSFDKVFKKFN